MPAKRKLSEADAPAAAVPPSLPPSVEEAYRRKCVQLKNRTQEVEDANDAARLRLARIKRQVEKLRIERAFLLEQLAKRTSTNVEDSEGSPSPPPTPVDIRNGLDANPRKPKDKPLRIKRGHRKSTANDAEGKADAANSTKDPGSPASESQSQQPESQSKRDKDSSANGVSKSSKSADSAFELFCEDARPALEDKHKDSDVNMDEELARAWEELPDAEKDEYREKHEAQSKKQQDRGSKEPEESEQKERKSADESTKAEAQDEDVEMAQYDTEDQETQMDKDGEE